MSNFEIKGKVLVIDDTVTISDKFKKRDFVIEVENERNSEWNDFIKFQLTQDRVDLIEPIKLGQEINVSFNIKGRKWEKDGKVNYFSNLEAWRISAVVQEEHFQGNTQQESAPEPPEESDLPF